MMAIALDLAANFSILNSQIIMAVSLKIILQEVLVPDQEKSTLHVGNLKRMECAIGLNASILMLYWAQSLPQERSLK